MPDRYFVLVAIPPIQPTLDLLNRVGRPGAVTAHLTHAPGISWPRRNGAIMAEEVLRQDGAVVLEFATLADAMTCHAQMLRNQAAS